MKVIKNNFDKFPMQVTCIHCESILELESIEDVYGGMTEPRVVCPCCKVVTPIDLFGKEERISALEAEKRKLLNNIAL
jgi:hypothetical protein